MAESLLAALMVETAGSGSGMEQIKGTLALSPGGLEFFDFAVDPSDHFRRGRLAMAQFGGPVRPQSGWEAGVHAASPSVGRLRVGSDFSLSPLLKIRAMFSARGNLVALPSLIARS
jgi:hypothetical protein